VILTKDILLRFEMSCPFYLSDKGDRLALGLLTELSQMDRLMDFPRDSEDILRGPARHPLPKRVRDKLLRVSERFIEAHAKELPEWWGSLGPFK